MNTTKEELLEHYGERKPTRFIQVDVHDVGVDGGDYIMQPNANGFAITGSETWELMRGPVDGMRVLINPKMPKERIRAALVDLLAHVEWIDDVRETENNSASTPKVIRVWKLREDEYDYYCEHAGSSDDFDPEGDLRLCPSCTRLLAAGVPVERTVGVAE